MRGMNHRVDFAFAQDHAKGASSRCLSSELQPSVYISTNIDVFQGLNTRVLVDEIGHVDPGTGVHDVLDDYILIRWIRESH